jgi:hypothetical protein
MLLVMPNARTTRGPGLRHGEGRLSLKDRFGGERTERLEVDVVA